MPLFEYLCKECGETFEMLVTTSGDSPLCSSCGSGSLKKLLSAHSSMSGMSSNAVAGPGDTACCGSSPENASCAGPGSCCGKALH